MLEHLHHAYHSMSAYEKAYLILVFIQTVLLVWYAAETRRLRIAAAKQLTTIENQHAEMVNQNKLIAKQAKSALEEAKFQRDEIIKAAEPVFTFHLSPPTVANVVRIMVQNFRDNVAYSEFRCKLRFAVEGVIGSLPHKRIFVIQMEGPARVVHVGIQYKTARNEVRHQVFEITLSSGKYERQTNVDYSSLASIIIS